jgi:thiol-disulfide isomerase/thioredoxin
MNRFVCALALVCCLSVCRNEEQFRNNVIGGLRIGEPLPALELQDLGGQTVTLSSFEGRAILLNLWATWCVPCLDEMPELEELQFQYDPTILSVVGISIDDTPPSMVHAFLEKNSITYTMLMADGEALLDALHLPPGIPHTILLDDNGLVSGYWRGRFHPFDPDIEALIASTVSKQL